MQSLKLDRLVLLCVSRGLETAQQHTHTLEAVAYLCSDSVWSHLQNAIFDVAAQGVNDAFVVSNEQEVVADCHCRAADTTR